MPVSALVWRISLSAKRWPPSDQIRGHASPGYALFLARARLRPRRQAEIEVARLERILVLAQRRIVRRRRHREAGRQLPVEHARALELVEARQVGQRLEPEMRQELLGRSVGERTARRL